MNYEAFLGYIRYLYWKNIIHKEYTHTTNIISEGCRYKFIESKDFVNFLQKVF